MKRLLIGTAMAGALGVVAWGGVAMVAEVAASRWLEDRRSEGWVANVADISVSGFPAQFVTAFEDVDLTDPDTGFAWSVASFEVRQDILRLDRIEVHWPTEQVIASRVERLTLRGVDGEDHPLIATLDVQPINRVALDALSFETGPMQVLSSAGWQTAWQEGSLTVDRVEDAEATYDLVALTTLLAPPDPWRALLDPTGALPAAIDNTTVRARARFDAPWNMDALGAARPQVSEVQLEDVSVRWGDMLLRTTGTLNVTPSGVPEGELAVRAENWATMMELANAAGLVPEQFAVTADAMLEMLAGLSGEPEHIDTTLLFANGRMLLGGVLPIGPAPNLHVQ